MKTTPSWLPVLHVVLVVGITRLLLACGGMPENDGRTDQHEYRDAIRNRAGLTKADLSGDDLSGLNLSRRSFYCANCRGTNFDGADLRWSDFRGADLTSATFRNALVFRTVAPGNVYVDSPEELELRRTP